MRKSSKRRAERLYWKSSNPDVASAVSVAPPKAPRTTDPWRAKQLKKAAHQLQQLELRGEGVVALCHCGWQSKPATTERKAHNAFARHKAAPSA